ncbi:hypothetical protein Cgig2_011545 [Carnegiea gigantea]|uniref:Uncharacterized protein n=1 Tax=Carnegiea gigantea TaxID=171969 RepID=A0A9Q1GMJ8_9CARY|nr:hypothetical protein Cgig2_011545 [Carnegiea gigantea]
MLGQHMAKAASYAHLDFVPSRAVHLLFYSMFSVAVPKQLGTILFQTEEDRGRRPLPWLGNTSEGDHVLSRPLTAGKPRKAVARSSGLNNPSMAHPCHMAEKLAADVDCGGKTSVTGVVTAEEVESALLSTQLAMLRQKEHTSRAKCQPPTAPHPKTIGKHILANIPSVYLSINYYIIVSSKALRGSTNVLMMPSTTCPSNNVTIRPNPVTINGSLKLLEVCTNSRDALGRLREAVGELRSSDKKFLEVPRDFFTRKEIMRSAKELALRLRQVGEKLISKNRELS